MAKSMKSGDIAKDVPPFQCLRCHAKLNQHTFEAGGDESRTDKPILALCGECGQLQELRIDVPNAKPQVIPPHKLMGVPREVVMEFICDLAWSHRWIACRYLVEQFQAALKEKLDRQDQS